MTYTINALPQFPLTSLDNMSPSPQQIPSNCNCKKRRRESPGMEAGRTRRRITSPEIDKGTARRAVLKRKRTGHAELTRSEKNGNRGDSFTKQSSTPESCTALKVQADVLVATSTPRPYPKPHLAEITWLTGPNPTISVEFEPQQRIKDHPLPHTSSLLSAPGAGQVVTYRSYPLPVLNLDLKTMCTSCEVRQRSPPQDGLLLEEVEIDADGIPCFETPGAKAMMDQERIMDLDEEVV